MGDNFIKRQQAKENAIAQAAFDSGFQAACDLLVPTLRDPEVVGSDIHGFTRINKIYIGLRKHYSIYEDAWTTKKEADVAQEHLDAIIRPVAGEHFEPFAKRHPYVKQPSYKHGRKDWR
jgi:hypothetical protein